MLQSKHGALGSSRLTEKSIIAVDISPRDWRNARSRPRHEDPEIVAGRAGAANAGRYHRVKSRDAGQAAIRAARNVARPAIKLMFDSESFKQPTAGLVKSDSETVTVTAVNGAPARGKSLRPAYPATRLPIC
ncbi:MAG: hypothetical protein ACE5EU_15210 [Paracoccaceae bacterium]